MTIPVHTGLTAFSVALAGLPASAHASQDAAGAIAVLDGAAGWWNAVGEAAAAGACAVLVAEPLEVPLELAGTLARRCPVPILVHRSRLRHDLVSRAAEQRAGAAPRIVVAECRASRGGLGAMVRDAAGWMRELSSAHLTVAAAAGAGGGSALLCATGSDRVVGSMSITRTQPTGMLLRVTGLGEVSTELEIDEPAGRSELATSSSGGRLVAPALFEAPERAALRRAISTVTENLSPTDLADLLSDEEVQRAILGARRL